MNKWMPCLYATYYGLLKEAAEECGFALALHGSFVRDMDLILVPWEDDAKPVREVLQRWHDIIGIRGYTTPWASGPTEKPHGRFAFTLQTGGGGYVDVSVVSSRREDRTSCAQEPPQETAEQASTNMQQAKVDIT
jgi:hypothetical protein